MSVRGRLAYAAYLAGAEAAASGSVEGNPHWGGDGLLATLWMRGWDSVTVPAVLAADVEANKPAQ